MRLETVLSTSLVLAGTRLLSNMDEVNDFRSRSEVGEIVVAVAGSVGGTIQEPGYILQLGKERITLELFASQSSIKKEFPSGREELPRVAAVAQTAIDASNVENRPPEAVGYNIEMVYTQQTASPASEYISERLIASELSRVGDRQWQLVGGSGKLAFEDEGRTRNLVIEPRLNDASTPRMFFSMNLHIPGNHLPDKKEIASSLLDVWKESEHFMEYFTKICPGNDR